MSPIAKRRTFIVVTIMVATILLQQIADYHARRTPVTCGDDIKFAGEYFLDDDCAATGPYAIRISQNDIDLDLNGHTIDCQGNGYGIQMTNQKNIRIHDGHIKDCNFGIIGSSAKNNQITNMTFENIKTIGIILQGSDNHFYNNIFKNFSNGAFGIHSPGQNYVFKNNQFKKFETDAITIWKP